MKNVLLKDLITPANIKSRSISAENFTGEKGKGGIAEEGFSKNCARDLGVGWKVSPCISIKAHDSFVLADIKDEGMITHFWCTCFPTTWRSLILKVYWDDSEIPSIQTPIGDFFLNGWCERSLVSSLLVTVNPAGGFNSYFQMPFKKRAKFVIENISNEDIIYYYQIDYELLKLPEEIVYFHAFWRRENPCKYKEMYTILPKIKGKGHFIGTYLATGVNNNGWWGEGEIKFYIDNDLFPTICGTGTEDYFGGAWNFEMPQGEYKVFSTPYQGLHQVIKPDGLYKANMRFGMYRWHITDPVYFDENLEVKIQLLGWRKDGRYLPLQNDVASVSYWYQTTIANELKMIEDEDSLEVI